MSVENRVLGKTESYLHDVIDDTNRCDTFSMNVQGPNMKLEHESYPTKNMVTVGCNEGNDDDVEEGEGEKDHTSHEYEAPSNPTTAQHQYKYQHQHEQQHPQAQNATPSLHLPVQMMNNFIVHPTKLSADTVIQQVGALGSDVVSDVKDIGQLVFKPVVDVTKTATGANTNNSAIPKDTTYDERVDLFAKTAMAIFNSVVVYAIADIRNLIRNHREKMTGSLEMIQQMIDLPISDINVMIIVLENVTLLQQMMRKGEIDFYISAVQRYRKELNDHAQRQLSERETQRPSDVEDTPPASIPSTSTPIPTQQRRHARRRSIYESIKQERASITLEVFEDENSTKELVYGISVNRYVPVPLTSP
jgi:hypothetical protein